MNIRCWLFGHEWLHLDSHITPEHTLMSASLCDRCGAERGVEMDVWYLDGELEESDDLPNFEDLIDEDGDADE